MPWRPEADPSCPNGGTAWRAADGNCYNGFAFDVAFDFSGQGLLLPDEIVFGLAFNTQSYGSQPLGASGPYNSLNFGLSSAATAGTDINTDGVFWTRAS
ncbi:MAG: hypothetical protein IPM15_08090 [Betaproteobacteria bacterium]|nr:hypothetical protein [Betaproteobacteria bacterium]